MTVIHRMFCLGSIALLAACSHSSAPTAPPGGHRPELSAATDNSFTAPAAVLKTSTYDVVLKPDTQLIDAAAMARSYRGAATDGTLTFDALSAPGVAALKPGTIVIFAGTALLKVTRVSSSGGKISVAGTPAGLEDAIDHGRIAWSAPLDFGKAVFNPPPGFQRVATQSGPLLALANFFVQPALADFSLANNTWSGTSAGWKIKVALTPSDGNLHLDVDASKSIPAGGTIEVHGIGQFNGLTNEGAITLADGTTTEITFNNKGLSGSVDFTWKVAFDAQHGGNDPKIGESAVTNLPFSLDVPIPAGPIPLKISFKAGYAFQPTFSSKVAVAEGSYHASFGGDLPMTAQDSSSTPTGDAAGSLSGKGSIDSYGGTLSVAAIGLSTTIAMPKIVLTVGMPSALDTFLGSPDLGGPYATLMTQANFLATGTLTMVQCEKRELRLLAFVGYKPGVLGKLKMPTVGPKNIFEKDYAEIIPPNITLCNH